MKTALTRFIYTILFYLGLPFLLTRLLIKSRNLPAYRKRLLERFGFFKMPSGLQNGIWIHAVSVGETIAARPLVAALQKQYSRLSLVITSTTPTGSERVIRLFPTAFHVYLPYDLPDAVQRFLNQIKPKIGILLETELWPNLLAICSKKQIPLLLINARLSSQSFHAYSKISCLTQAMLKQVRGIGIQNEIYKQRFKKLGAIPSTLHVTGNLKFDLSIDDGLQDEARRLRSCWGGRPVWIAASTHEGEETIILGAFKQIQKSFPESILILCPRHPERFTEVFSEIKSHGFVGYKRSSTTLPPKDIEIYLADTMGELMALYAASDVVFVGGSLVPTGGHNLLEPVALGIPTLSGPYTHNFTEIVLLLTEKKAITIVSNQSALAEAVVMLLQNPAQRQRVALAGKEIIAENRGAVNRSLALIRQFL